MESQFIESAPAETDLQPPFPNADIEIEEDKQDEGKPSTPRVHVIPVSPDRCAMPPPQLQIPSASNLANIYSRKSKSLQVNIQDPPSKELVRCMTEAFLTPLPSLSNHLLFRRKDPPPRAL